MKQMEYTIKVTTEGPVVFDALTEAITEAGIDGIVNAEVVSYRMKPTPRKEKT